MHELLDRFFQIAGAEVARFGGSINKHLGDGFLALFAPGTLLGSVPAPEGCTLATGQRVAVTMACEECKRRNYQTMKSRRNTPDRVELRKFCRWCGRHTPHKETR